VIDYRPPPNTHWPDARPGHPMDCDCEACDELNGLIELPQEPGDPPEVTER
jgi:hypothetical protein